MAYGLGQKIAYPSDDEAELRAQYGTSYDPNTTYYYNTHSEYLTTGEKFTTDENAAAGEDRAHYKSGDKVGNFRVVEKSIRDTDKKKTVYHEERLLRTNLLLYLQENKTEIANLVFSCANDGSAYDRRVKDRIHKWYNSETSEYDIEAFYDDVKVFLNTHDDDSIIRWIKNHLGTNANYSDLSALLKDIANRYLIYTDTLYNTYHTDLESGKYSDYVGRTLADFKSKSQLSFSDVTSLDNSAFSNLVDKYKKYVLDTFCDIHPEHHRGNSFVMTNDQNYDVNYLAELNYDVAEEIESPFTFAIFNTRVGSQKVDIKMTWTDGNNDAGVRPDAVKCMITSSQPVFGDYNDNEMAEMGMERVQLTVQDNVRTYSVYKDITTGTEYYFDGTSYYSKSGDDYVHTSTHAENLQIVWNNYRATIMMTYDKDTDPHNKAQEWTYNKRNDLPKYTFANPMNRAEYPAENSAEYGSKSDGTAISYTVSPVGYYANIGSDENPIYVAWSNSSTSYSGPSGGMIEATASAPNPEINPNHTGDVYHYAYAGAASGTANLVVNKYWMDADNSSKANPKVRPDISFDIYASYKTADDKMTIAYMGAFSPLTEVGVEDEKWWTTTASLGKYTSDGYLINYYACERVTTEGDTDYEETETFIGRPTRYYVTYDENEYYTVNYNNNEYVTISGTNHTVQNYQSVEINGTIYEADDTTVTIGGTNYQIHTEDSFRYINYPTSNDRKYYLKNSTTLRIIDIDGKDYPVYRNSSNKYVIKYNNVEYLVSYYIDMNGTRTPASVNGKSVTIDAVTVKANDNDVVRYAKKDYQLKGYVKIDGKEYSLVKPTRKYVEIDNVKYGVRDSMDGSGNKHSDIANYSDILDKFWLIKTGTNIQLDSNGNTQNIIEDTNEQRNGYIRVVPLTFNSSTGDYNQGTSVNRPTSKRQLSGSKIWKAESLPRFNSGSYDKNLLPDMTLTIYRYSYDEIKEMREHDVAIESSLADDATEEQRAVAEANMYLKPIKNNDTATAKDRKYPKLVDSEHLVKANYIKENGDETDFHLTNDYKYNIKVTFEGSTDTLDKNDLYKAVTSELISQNESGFTWAFNFDGFYFDRYDSRGKPYTYVLQEGYTTNVEVWRYLTADENNSDRKDERVFIGKIDGTQAHSDTVTIDSHVTKEEGYTYYLKLVEGTDALSENYTFAYDLEQSDDGLEITNLYNMDQSLSIKLKKLWSGLPENLDPSEYPTTTFKLVRYLQDRDGSKIERSKEDVLFTQEDFNLQEYFTLGDTKIFLENQKEVEIENYSIPYDIVADEDGLHIAYNESTLVRGATTEYPNGYIMIAGVAYPLTTSDTLVVADDTYTVKNVNGQNYIKIDVKSGEIKKYVVMDDVNTYITGENTFNINGTGYNVSGNHLSYDPKTKVTEKTLTAVNGNVSINGKNYAVATASGSSYFEMNGDKYTLTQTSTEENTYTAECVTIGGKDYYLLTDAENNQYIKTGTEVYGIVQSGSQKYVNIDVRELKTDNYISWRYRKYSLVDKDNGYYARIGSQYYEVYGEGTEKYLIIPVEGNKVNVNGISYEVTSSGVKIGKKSYDVIEVDGNQYMKVPVQSSSGYRYNFETDAQDNIISVEVAYTGLAESEIELRWNNLPYYAPNMRPYIYDIQELGVTDGFTVTTLADDDDKNYENNNNGSASDVSPSGESVDSNDVWEKKDYTTTLILNPDNKKDKTTVNVGLSNNYEGSNGSVKIQKTWEGDMDYNVSPRPANLKVKLYRTFYDTYVTLGNTVYPVERQQYIELPDANYQTHKFYVDSAVDGKSGIVYYYVDVDAGTYRLSEDVPWQQQKFTIQSGANSITVDGQACTLRGSSFHGYTGFVMNNEEYILELVEDSPTQYVAYYITVGDGMTGKKYYVTSNYTVKIDGEEYGCTYDDNYNMYAHLQIPVKVNAGRYEVHEGKVLLSRYVDYLGSKYYLTEGILNGEKAYYITYNGNQYWVENGRVKIEEDIEYVKDAEVPVQNFEQHIKIGSTTYTVDGSHLAYNNDTRIKGGTHNTDGSSTGGSVTLNGTSYSVQTKYTVQYDGETYNVTYNSGSKKFSVTIKGKEYTSEPESSTIKVDSANCTVKPVGYIKIDNREYLIESYALERQGSSSNFYFEYGGINYPIQKDGENRTYININGDRYYTYTSGGKTKVNIRHVDIPVMKTPQNRTDANSALQYNTSHENDTNVDMPVYNDGKDGNNKNVYLAVGFDDERLTQQSVLTGDSEIFELVGEVKGSEWTANEVKNLPIYSPNGRKYYYYIVETKVPDGYTQTAYSEPVSAVPTNTPTKNVTKITNTLVPTEATAKKEWVDDSADHEKWDSDSMLFASKLSGIAQTIKYRIAYSTTDFIEGTNPDSVSTWSDWKWVTGECVEIDGVMYYPYTKNNKQYIKIVADKNTNNAGSTESAGGAVYNKIDKSYIQTEHDVHVKSVVIDGNNRRYIEFERDGIKYKYDVTENNGNPYVTIDGGQKAVSKVKYFTLPYDVNVHTVNGEKWIAFSIDGVDRKYKAENNKIVIDGISYPLKTKTVNNANVEYIVIERDIAVLKETVGEKEYIQVDVDGVTYKRYLDEYNSVELEDNAYMAKVGGYVTITADVPASNVVFTRDKVAYIGYTGANGKIASVSISETDSSVTAEDTEYSITQKKYINAPTEIEVKKENGLKYKYITYTDKGEYKTYYLNNYLERTMELTQEFDSQGNVIGGTFPDINWSEELGDKLPQYIMVEEQGENNETVRTLKKVRYMPVEYSLTYNKTNYQDGSLVTAEYNRKGVAPNTIADDAILTALNDTTSNNNTNKKTDTFDMGFVSGKTNYGDIPDGNGETTFMENTSHTTNTVGRKKIVIIKDWGDDYNRDDYRGDFTLNFRITRQKINYGEDTQEVLVTLSEDDAYTYTDSNNNEQTDHNIWMKSFYVPVTSNYDKNILSVYTVEELGPADSMYDSDFRNYVHISETGEYIESGENKTDVQHINFAEKKGTKSEVGSLDKEAGRVTLSNNDDLNAVDRYAAFKNTKERLEFKLSPSKLWYNVNGEMYPDTDKVMPEWAKKIFFPDGNPQNLRIRFKLQYQISDDENAQSGKWLYVTDVNSAYPNAKADLAGIEPYLEFTVNDKGEITPVRNESWDNLPKHYYTEQIKVHKNYLYRVQEVIVRGLEEKEVAVSQMYINFDDSDFAITGNGSTLQVTVPAPTNQNPNATETKTVTLQTDANGYVYVTIDGKKYYVKADEADGRYNYVTKKTVEGQDKYYIVTGQESAVPTDDITLSNDVYINTGTAEPPVYKQITVTNGKMTVDGTEVDYDNVNGFLRVNYSNNYYYAQRKVNTDSYYYVFVRNGEYYVITDDGDIIAENEFDTRYQISYDKSFINGDKVDGVSIRNSDGTYTKYYVSKTVKIGDDYYTVMNRMYYKINGTKHEITVESDGKYKVGNDYVEIDQGLVTIGENTYEVGYDEYIVYDGVKRDVTSGGVKIGEDTYRVTSEKIVTVGNRPYEVKKRKYYVDNAGTKHILYSDENNYYIMVNGQRQNVTVSHGVIEDDANTYHIIYEEYITYNNNDYVVEAVEGIQTQNTVNKAKASVAKTWNDADNNYSTRPYSVMYEIQYRPQDKSEEWQNVDEGWLFDAYKDSIANSNKLSAIKYQSVADGKPYFRFDGDKYYVKKDIERKYVIIDGEKFYIGTNNKLTLDGTEYSYTSGDSITVNKEYAVMETLDDGKDYILVNGHRIYVVSNKVTIDGKEFTVSDSKVTIDKLTVKTETFTADVEYDGSSYYYMLDGVKTTVTDGMYIQTTSEKPSANVTRDVNNKVAVTKDGTDLKIPVTGETQPRKAVKTAEKVYIKVNLSEDEKEVPKILIDKLPSTDSKNRTLEYRFVESYLYYKGETAEEDIYVPMPSENSLYKKTETTVRDETGNYPSDDTTVVNKIQTTSLTVKKTWGEDIYNIAKNIASVKFEIQRRVKDGAGYTEWETVEKLDGENTLTGADIAITWTNDETVQGKTSKYNNDTGWTGLPKYDNQNREYEYRAVEKSITPQGSNAAAVNVESSDSGTSGTVGGFNYTSYHDRSRNNDGDVTSYHSVLTNTPVVSKLAVTKEWIDDNDRDAPRKAVTLQLKATAMVDGEEVEIPVPADKKTVTVENPYITGHPSSDYMVTEDGHSYYPNNYYFVWYKLPVYDEKGNPILYTISEDKTNLYNTQVRVTDYSSADGNNSTTVDGKYTYVQGDEEKGIDSEQKMYIVVDNNGNDEKITVVIENGELAVAGDSTYKPDIANMNMYMKKNGKRYFVYTDVPSAKKYVEIGGEKVEVNNNTLTIDGTSYTPSNDDVVTLNKVYNVETDDETGSYITVNGKNIAVQKDSSNEEYVKINGQRFNVVSGEGDTKKVTISSLNLKSTDPVSVSPVIGFESREEESDHRVYASTYLREAETTPEFKATNFTGKNTANSLTYNPLSINSPVTNVTKEYEQLEDVTKIDFKDVYVPRTVNIQAVKHWLGDSERNSEVWKTSRPPQGVKYTIQYRRVDTDTWYNIPFQETDVSNAADAWKNVYNSELSGTSYKAVNTVGKMAYDENGEPIYDNSEEKWNLTWESLPVYEKYMVGVKFEYRVVEDGIDYSDGKRGLYNYVTSYGGAPNNGGATDPTVLRLDDMEEENADLTEDIYNKLRTAFVKKEIDPDYIGNVRPELYNKPFDFDITITDMNNRSIPELAMQIIRVDGTIENITLTEDNPKASVSLKHGDEVSLFNIPPEGMKYMVEEADYYSQGFISYVSVDDGAETRTRIARGQFGGEGQHSILYTNRPLPLPSTGGSGIQIFIEMSFALIMFGALLGLMYWLAKRKQLDKQLN